jgi:hypothetical protein
VGGGVQLCRSHSLCIVRVPHLGDGFEFRVWGVGCEV